MIRKIARKLRNRFLGSWIRQFEQQEGMIKALADANFRTRSMLKHSQNQPIHVLFVCHEPALWSIFDSVYKTVVEDPDFTATVVALPYRHSTLPEGQYQDKGVFEYLKEKGVNVIRGYDKEKNEWLNPLSLNPDYVFFQTPYPVFPESWSVKQISMIAKICYIPYATCLFAGEVEEGLHPISFFNFTSIFFKESSFCKEIFVKIFKNRDWFNEKKVILSGLPKLDYLIDHNELIGRVWKRGLQKNIKRILWTPRWRTSEGTCHFFDYKDYFVNYSQKHKDIDIVLRPHPLCLQNFLKTNELSASDLERMENEYDNSLNMAIDKTGEYIDTFLTSDVLVSDISSMLLEYFVTGKPIIYTHRVDVFNDFGRQLSKGFYWVKNSAELKETLEMLIAGNDPLREKREELIKLLLFLPEGGAGLRIKEVIRTDFSPNPIALAQENSQ